MYYITYTNNKTKKEIIKTCLHYLHKCSITYHGVGHRYRKLISSNDIMVCNYEGIQKLQYLEELEYKMRENELEKVLKEHGQEHIWEAYQKLDEAGKEKLASQVERVDWSMVAMAGHEELAQERGKL